MQEIIELYRKFKRYDKFNDNELRLYLFPSLNLDQNKKLYIDNKLVAFTNWAFLSDRAYAKFKKTGFIKKEDWRSGNHLCWNDVIGYSNINEIVDWTKSLFFKKFGIDRSVSWLRIKNDKIIRQVTRTITRSWE